MMYKDFQYHEKFSNAICASSDVNKEKEQAS